MTPREPKAKAGSAKGGGEPKLVLYRCPTPTNVLCPCGAVARRLGKLELDYRTERVPYRRAGRPEIVELTRQRRVPVLVDGEEVVHDSKRIIEYLDWKYGGDEDED
jgi:glutathione S-transferase-like protein